MLTRYRNSVRTKWRYRFVTLMQEVCGSCAGRKRLVAVVSDGRRLGVSRVVLVQWRTGKQAVWTNGDAGMLWAMVEKRANRAVWFGHGEYQLES
jgi:UDP-glucuronate 4-epimerase